MACALTPAPNDLLGLIQLRRQRATQVVLEAKRQKGATWEQIATAVGRSPVWVTSCCLGENAMDVESAEKLVAFLGLEGAEAKTTVEVLVASVPMKGQLDWSLAVQDPTIYRLHEVNQIYGLTLKELIQEKFGDGIMSAIDFTMELEKEQDPKGDRVKIIMSGKFLPYKKW